VATGRCAEATVCAGSSGNPGPAYGERVRAELRAPARLDTGPTDTRPVCAIRSGAALTAPEAVRVPAPLVVYYRAALAWPWIVGVQNAVRLPSEMELDADTGLLVFAHESQSVVRWAVDPEAGADQPVWLPDWEDEALREREPLSGFLVQFALAETVWGRAHRAHGLGSHRHSPKACSPGHVRCPGSRGAGLVTRPAATPVRDRSPSRPPRATSARSPSTR
jgi:hypothetical protein